MTFPSLIRFSFLLSNSAPPPPFLTVSEKFLLPPVCKQAWPLSRTHHPNTLFSRRPTFKRFFFPSFTRSTRFPPQQKTRQILGWELFIEGHRWFPCTTLPPMRFSLLLKFSKNSPPLLHLLFLGDEPSSLIGNIPLLFYFQVIFSLLRPIKFPLNPKGDLMRFSNAEFPLGTLF